jgi:hypothetical protein
VGKIVKFTGKITKNNYFYSSIFLNIFWSERGLFREGGGGLLRGSFQLSFHICGNVSILYITSEVFDIFSKFKKQMKEYKILEFFKYKIFSKKIFQVKGDPPKITIAANVKAHKKALINP